MITRHMRTHSNARKGVRKTKQRRRKKLACTGNRSSPSDIEEPESSNIDVGQTLDEVNESDL